MDLEIVNTEGDFLQTQNYVIQLVAEKVISSTDFLLYCFYRSVSGFREIRCGYDYISLNTSISKGGISAGNDRLMEAGLIKIRKFGKYRPFQIFLVPGSNLPRRKLKKVEREEGDNEWIEKYTEKYVDKISDSFKKTTRYNLYDYVPTEEIRAFIDKFVVEWCDRNGSGFYHKNDYAKLEEIRHEIVDAVKYIPVLWSLDSVDKWVKDSDHSISIFVKMFKDGKLQNQYPSTKYYWIDKQAKEDQEDE